MIIIKVKWQGNRVKQKEIEKGEITKQIQRIKSTRTMGNIRKDLSDEENAEIEVEQLRDQVYGL